MRPVYLFLFHVIVVPFVFSSEILTEGAERGKWSMDLEASTNLARKNQLSLFLDFTGSDWCGWCKIMKRKIFITKEWQKFAYANLALVTIDFPQNQRTVPEKFWARNQNLQMKYGVMGYPTYVILDPDGRKELGRLGAGRNQDVDQFIDGVREVLKQSKASVNKLIEKLSLELVEEYKGLLKIQEETQGNLENWLKSRPEQTPENLDHFLNFHSKLTNLSIKIQKIEAGAISKGLSPEQEKKYMAYVAKLNTIRKELNDWLCSRPESTAQNKSKQAQLENQINELSKKINGYR